MNAPSSSSFDAAATTVEAAAAAVLATVALEKNLKTIIHHYRYRHQQ